MARTKKRIVKVYDLGPEPTDARGTAKLIRAYQWYNYEHTLADGRKFADAYFKTRSRNDQQFLSKLTDSEIGPTFMWIARMRDRGVELGLETLDWFNRRYDDLLTMARAKNEEVKTEVPVVKKTTVRSDFLIATLDEHLDFTFDKKDWNFNVYTWLQGQKATKADYERLVAYYQPQLDELRVALSGKDDQLVEAYSFLKKTELRKRVDFMTTFVSDIQRLINNKVVVRKPRKKRTKSASDLVKRVKYQQASVELKITSVNPEKIIGASQVWLYNTKYNQLGVLNAQDGGFTIKGTTIENVDETSSKMKRLRKPKDQLTSFMACGKVQMRKFLETVNSKEYAMKGRLNANTVILRVS